MYLHVGNDRIIRIGRILGIFDADTATVSEVTKKYLSAADAERRVSFSSEEIPKSFILYTEEDRGGEERFCICFSPLSTASLEGRLEKGQEEWKWQKK